MKNKWIATLLAFFLGWIGIHKFYLGENVGGVFYFLFSWTGIPAILAIFDLVGLLLTSDRVFNAKFNGGINAAYVPPMVYGESSRDKAATIAELKKLYDMGAITAEEYEEKRRKFLDAM